jgi:hypothetical protein
VSASRRTLSRRSREPPGRNGGARLDRATAACRSPPRRY